MASDVGHGASLQHERTRRPTHGIREERLERNQPDELSAKLSVMKFLRVLIGPMLATVILLPFILAVGFGLTLSVAAALMSPETEPGERQRVLV